MRRHVSLLVVFGLGALAGFPRLPAAAPADAPPDTFAAARAMEHVRAWAVAPRPSGSPAHAAVLDGIERELVALGLVVTREENGARSAKAGRPRLVNLVARPAPAADATDAAPARGGGVWLVAHSDSVPGSPGAADDGLGLGVIVEAARALSVGGVPPDLHVLVTDGEERGLLGALSHVRGGPGASAGPPRLVLNVEARGTEGPAYMFQTAGPTGALLGAWRRSGCGAQATSLARTVYDELPNDTDFTVFRQAGWWGYDFALIHGAWRYHTADDTPANLDPRSVQQVGDCVVGLAREWLARSFVEGSPADEPVYAQLPGGTFVLPSWVARLLAAGLLVATALALRGRDEAPPERPSPRVPLRTVRDEAHPGGPSPRVPRRGERVAEGRVRGGPPEGPQILGAESDEAHPGGPSPRVPRRGERVAEGRVRGGPAERSAPEGTLAWADRGVTLRGALVGGLAWGAALGGALLGGYGLLVATARLRGDFWERPAEVEGPGLHYALAVVVGALAAESALSLARRLAPDAARGWHLAGIALAGVAGLAVPSVGYVLLPGALASAALLAGRPRLALVPAALAGLLLAPVLYAIFPALTTRMTPVLCAVPALLLGWLVAPGPAGARDGATGAAGGLEAATSTQRLRRLPEDE